MSSFENARFIKAQAQPEEYALYDPLPFFRKEFTVTEPVENARVFVQSPGFAVYYLNGKRITEDLFISPVSNYHKILWYNVYDVTSLLRPGKNVLGVICGNGFFNESFDSAWHYQKAVWRDAPQFMLELHIDGKSALVSDTSWKCSKEASHIIYSHLRSGEYVDMRKYDPAWLMEDYDDSKWENAIERLTPVTGQLRLTPCQPVREKEEIEPVSVTETDEGLLVDFGRNFSGYTQITLQAQRGQEIVLRYAEEIDGENHLKLNGMNRPGFYPVSPVQTNKMIASGGRDRFKPLFSYFGFRYMVIEGLQDASAICDLKAYFTHQDVKQLSCFTCGNDIINFIYEAGIRSTYSNLFWSLTDCPTREKLGWANDAQASLEQTLIDFDIVPLYRKWFEDLKSGMEEDGALPGIIPSPNWGFHYGPVCDALLFELPYKVYLYTGERDLLTENLSYFHRYIGFFREKIAQKQEFELGDWMGYHNNEAVPKEFVLDFYWVRILRITALAHNLAGDTRNDWQRQAEQAKTAFMDKYLAEDGHCIINAQSSAAMMLACGFCKDAPALQEQLLRAVERDGFALNSGMVGLQYLYDALSLCGKPEYVVKMITESDPGFRRWYDRGATTLWETWVGYETSGGSRNHHMLSNVLAWFFKYLLGIAPKEDAPGFCEVELQPRFVRQLGFAQGSMVTVRGEIKASWKWDGGGFTYEVTVPEGIRAVFRGAVLQPGKNVLYINEDENA
jgi:alpha-L-rhamnosidase